MGLIEVTNLHNRELVHGLLEGKSVQEAFSDISRDTTLSHAYLDKLKSIYTSPAYQDSIEAHPLREKKLKKEIIDAWVEEWRRMNLSKPTVPRLSQTSPPCCQRCRRMDSAGSNAEAQHCATRLQSQVEQTGRAFRYRVDRGI